MNKKDLQNQLKEQQIRYEQKLLENTLLNRHYNIARDLSDQMHRDLKKSLLSEVEQRRKIDELQKIINNYGE